MKRIALAGLVGLLGLSGAVYAIDRDASMIDTIGLNVANLDDVDSIGGTLLGEVALTVPKKDWAILAMIGYDEISPDYADNLDAWTGGLGLKYYLTPVTSLGVLGSYTRYDGHGGGSERDAKAGTAFAIQRLLPVDDPISPFVKGALTWRDRSTFSDFDPQIEEDSTSEVLLQVGGGVELNMDTDFTFVLEGGYVIADESNNGAEDLDGFLATFAMRYYFE